MGDDDELGLARVRAQQLEEPVDVEVVERRLDLVEDVERARTGEEHREQERERGHRLLATGQQRQPLHLLPGRGDLDLDAEQILLFLLLLDLAPLLGLLAVLRLLLVLRRRRTAAEHACRAVALGHQP